MVSHVLKCAVLPEKIYKEEWLVGLIACLTCQSWYFWQTIYLQISSKQSNEKSFVFVWGIFEQFMYIASTFVALAKAQNLQMFMHLFSLWSSRFVVHKIN